MSPKHKSGMLATIQDRVRIPWRGGAKQLTPDIVMPNVILGIAFIVASLSLVWTIVVTILVIVLINYLLHTLTSKIPRTKFFFIWSCISVIILNLIFQLLVVPLLEILQIENIVVGLLTLGFIICIFMMKKKSALLQYSQIGLTKVDSNRNMHCSICLITVPEGDYHSFWFVISCVT